MPLHSRFRILKFVNLGKFQTKTTSGQHIWELEILKHGIGLQIGITPTKYDYCLSHPQAEATFIYGASLYVCHFSLN